MKIGIVGYGKMGCEIFHGLFDKNDFMPWVTVVCIEDTEIHTVKIQKELDKALRRKKITEDVYNEKCRKFAFVNSLSELSGCDIVIECITEDLEEKRKVFKELSEIVSEQCIFASNTSSLLLEKIFEDVPNPERCIGMHFFYPVKLSGFVEINKLSVTHDKTVNAVRDISSQIGKNTVIFENDYHMYMNQFISLAVSQGIYSTEKAGIKVRDSMEILSEIFTMHGLFGMIDSIGLELLRRSSGNFQLERIQPVVKYGDSWMEKCVCDGCPGVPGTFLSYMENKQSAESGNIDAEELKCTVISVLLNEIVHMASEVTDPDIVSEAVADAVGIEGKWSDYYKTYGYERISSVLEILRNDTGWELYTPADKSLYDKYLDKER